MSGFEAMYEDEESTENSKSIRMGGNETKNSYQHSTRGYHHSYDQGDNDNYNDDNDDDEGDLSTIVSG